MLFFCYQAPSGQGGLNGQLSSYLSHSVIGLNPLDIGRSSSDIYLPLLVLHHNGWSTEEGMLTLQERA